MNHKSNVQAQLQTHVKRLRIRFLIGFLIIIGSGILYLSCATTIDDFYGDLHLATQDTHQVQSTQITESSKPDVTQTSETSQSSIPYTSNAETTGEPLATDPQLTVISPTPDQTVPSTFTVTGTATDDVEILYVEVKLDDGEFQRAMGLTNWTYVFNNVSLEDHILTVKAMDNHANETLETINITVADDNTSPEITIDTPSYGD